MHIRIATKDDSHDMAQIYAPIVERTHISFELVPPTADEMARRMAMALDKHVGLVAEEAGSIMGYAYAGNYREKQAYRWSTETTIYIGDGVRGKGVGRIAHPHSCESSRRKTIAGRSPESRCRTRRASRCTRPLGFRHIGTNPEAGFKFGRWHDLGGAFRLNAADGEPAPPVPLRLWVISKKSME